MKKTLRIVTVFLAVWLLLQGFFAVPSFAANEEVDLSQIKSEYVLTINIDTGKPLFEIHSGNGNYCYCGFLARIMTCAVLFEEVKNGNVKLTETVTLTSAMLAETPKRKTETFSAGDKVTLENLARAVLISNSQEACVAIACRLSGSTAAFVKRLNEKASELGMSSTTITNVHGYFDSSDPGWTTLEDVAKAVKYALDQDYFQDYANPGKEPYNILVSGTKKPLYLSNQILSSTTSYYNKKAIGIAASSSDNCIWYCACDMVMDGTQRLVTVVISLKSLDVAWKDVNTLLKLSTEKYKTLTVLTKGQVVTSVPVTRGKTKDKVTLVSAVTVDDTVPDSTDVSQFSFEYVLPESVKAPILKGDKIGEVIVTDYKGDYLTTVSLLAQTDITANEIQLFTDELNEFFSDWRVWIFIGGIIVIVLIYIIVSNRGRSKRKKHQRVRLRKR